MPEMIGSQPFLTAVEVAALMGVQHATVLAYRSKAAKNRASGISTSADMPEPDQLIGRTPVWYPETITSWLARRPLAGKPRRGA